ncbi:MAG: recombinase family protein [Pseudonocardiaceae bacterium]
MADRPGDSRERRVRVKRQRVALPDGTFRIRLNKREADHIRRARSRILAGVSALTLAREWDEHGIPTVIGGQWRGTSIRRMYLNPHVCGLIVYQGTRRRQSPG